MNEQLSSQKAAIISIFAIIAIYSVCFLLYSPTWSINDDTVMAMCASGKGFTDRPTEYLLWSNILLGIFLKMFYTAAPSVPWYGIYTVAVLCVSSTLLLYSMLVQKYSIERLLFFSVFFSVFGLYGFMHPQFTFNSFMLATAGVFLFIQRLEDGPMRKEAFYAVSVACLCAASLIRMHSMLLALVLALPSLAMGLKFRGRERGDLKRAGYWAAVVVLFVVATTAYDEYRHKGEGWRYSRDKEMAQQTVANGKISEYSSRTKPIFDEAGWSLNDYLIMLRWFFIDDEMMSYDKLSAVTIRLKSFPSHRTFMQFAELLEDPKLYLTLLIIVIVCFRLLSGRQRDLQTVLLTFIWGLCLIFCIGYFFRLPERIPACILSFLAFTAIYRADSGTSTGVGNRLAFPMTAIVVLLGFVAVVWQVAADREWRRQTAEFRQEMPATLFSRDQLYIIWADAFPFELMSIFDSFEIFSERALIFSFRSLKDPLSAETLKKFSIVKFRDMVSNEKVCHIGKPMDMALYGRYLKERYGIDVYFRVVARTSRFLVFTQHAVTPEVEGALTTAKVPVHNFVYDIRLLL